MTAKFIVTRHISEGRAVVAVCDAGVHGKRFEDGKTGLVLDLGSRFYKGEEKNAEETTTEMEKAYIINAAGKESVALALKLKLAAKENIKLFSGVPHVQVLRLQTS